MLQKSFPYLLCCLHLLLSACIDPYDLEGEINGTSMLVVDGMITNAVGPYQVKLSYSSTSLKGYEDTPLEGAQISITDDIGNEAVLIPIHNQAGVYSTDSLGIQGQSGRTYQLHITLPDGRRYVSQPETMPAVPPIDSIYAVLESRPYLTETNLELLEWGMEIYLNTGSNTSQGGFYRWDWVDTYEILTPMPPISGPFNCWISSRQVRYLNLATSQGLSRDRIERRPITFVSKRTKKLGVRYSILVKQYALTRSAYDYWEKIQDQIESAGSVFDPPPAQILGNMYNPDDEDELVLGYFQASSVTEKRLFINRSQVPSQGGSVGGFTECQEGMPMLPDYCYDCSTYPGATPVRPSFW